MGPVVSVLMSRLGPSTRFSAATAVVGLDRVAVGDVALARGRHGHVVHDGHLHVEAVAAPLPPLRPRDGELVALLHHAHRDTRPALTGAGHNRHYLES